MIHTIPSRLSGLQGAVEQKRRFDTMWPDSSLDSYERSARNLHLREDLQRVSEIRDLESALDEQFQAWLEIVRWEAQQASEWASEIDRHLSEMHLQDPALASAWDARLTAKVAALQDLAGELKGIIEDINDLADTANPEA